MGKGVCYPKFLDRSINYSSSDYKLIIRLYGTKLKISGIKINEYGFINTYRIFSWGMSKIESFCGLSWYNMYM